MCDRKEMNYGRDEQVGEEETARQGKDIMGMSSADE